MSESIGQDLLFDTLVSLSKWRRGVEDAVNVMLDASPAWSLPVALDFSVSATDAGIGRSARHARGRGSCSRHVMLCHLNKAAKLVNSLSLHLNLVVNS